jgi:aminopeptidase N
VAEIRDPLLRTMAWGALWDLTREVRWPPAEFAGTALVGLQVEEDQNISGSLLGRMLSALGRYIAPATAARAQPHIERLLLQRADDASLPYGMRKAAFDALLANARSAEGKAALRAYLADERRFDNKPIAQVSRWAAVRRLVALGESDAPALIEREARRDSTPERARSIYVARAAIPTQENKDAYFRAYLDDPRLNEEWVTASLGAFNDPMHTGLTLRYLEPALEKAEWIRDNRRIFFLPRWLESFIEGQSSAEALRIVDDFLASNPTLPLDVRRKILQSRDELDRTVRIRSGGTHSTMNPRSGQDF